MKRLILLCLLLAPILFIGTSCDFARNYYNDNKPLIQEVIKSVIEAIFEQIENNILSKDGNTESIKSIYNEGNTDNTTAKIIKYLQTIKNAVKDKTFWTDVDRRIQIVIDGKTGK